MKNSAAVLAVFSMLAIFMLFYAIFLLAYYSPEKAVSVDINSYGEADAEAVLLTALIPLNFFATYVISKRLVQDTPSIERKLSA